MNKLSFLLALLATLHLPVAHGTESLEPKMWGLSYSLRSAQVIYPNSTATNSVEDVLPLVYYDNDGWLFLEGLVAGIRFYNKGDWQISAIASYQFFDVPADNQNEFRGNALNLGPQVKYRLSPVSDLDFEILNDQDGRYHANLIGSYRWHNNKWTVAPYAKLRWKTADFNNYYYGLGIDTPGSGYDVTFGADVRYHVTSNFYLFGSAYMLILDQNTADISTINSQTQSVVTLGLGLFNDQRKQQQRRLKAKPYLRLAYGWASTSSLGEIVTTDAEFDSYNNRSLSLFYGYPLSDTLLGAPIPLYLTPGLIYHFNSEVQASFPEYVIAVKGFYTIKWPLRWRLGFGSGLSYSTHINYIEQQEMDLNGYVPSRFMAYLDVTLDLNLGDLFHAKSIDDLWLGAGVQHRSGIYETSSAFGRIKGGSNYVTAYLQYHF